MRLILRREPSTATATIGQLYVDGLPERLAFTLEDPVREIPGQPVESWKIPGATAIPAGSYRVVVTHSQRFGKCLPLLVAVPGFSGIRIHAGNTAADTEGCILVGVARGDGRESVLFSRSALQLVQNKIEDALTATGEVWIDVENPPAA